VRLMNPNVVKGLLIFLVVLDHNDFLSAEIPFYLRPLGFHVLSFLAIPFVLERDSTTSMLDKSFRYFWPFALFLTISTLLYQVILIGNTDLLTIVRVWGVALITGSGANVKAASGLYLLWFLPCIISLLLIKSWLKISQDVKPITIIISVFVAVGILFVPENFRANTPMQLPLAMFLLSQCLIISWAYRVVLASKMYKVLTILIMVIGVGLYLYCVKKGIRIEYARFLLPSSSINLIIAVLANLLLSISLFLICTANFTENIITRGFKAIGKYSLSIYLIHNFIYVALRIFGTYTFSSVWLNTVKEILLIIFVLVISYIFSLIIFKTKTLKILIFPKGYHELVSLLLIRQSVRVPNEK